MGTTTNQGGWNTNSAGGWSANNYDSSMGQLTAMGAQLDGMWSTTQGQSGQWDDSNSMSQSGDKDWWAAVGVVDSTPQSLPSSPLPSVGAGVVAKSSSIAAPPANKVTLPGLLALDEAVAELNEPSNPMIQQLEFEKQQLLKRQMEREQRMLEMEKQMMALQHQRQNPQPPALQSSASDDSSGMGLAERLAMSVAGDALNNAQAMLGQTGLDNSSSGVGASTGSLVDSMNTPLTVGVDSNQPKQLPGLALLDELSAELNEPQVASNGNDGGGPGPAEMLAMMVSQTKTATPKSSAPPMTGVKLNHSMLGAMVLEQAAETNKRKLEQAVAELPEKKVPKRMPDFQTAVDVTSVPAAPQGQKSSSSEKGGSNNKEKGGSNARVAPDEYEVILEGEDNEHGMTLSTAKDLKVKAIGEGLAEEWNNAHPENPIGIGDALVEVNGKRAKAADLLMALYSSLETNDKHRLKFKRRAGA